MLDQYTKVEIGCDAVEHEAPRMMPGRGVCTRCQSEGNPNPCYAFVGDGSICQRNWCSHSWADHS